MKEKGRLWFARATAVVFLVVILMQLVMERESAWSVLQAMMYFGVLLAGYRWGAAGGALGGVLCGLGELLWRQELEGLGLLCVMGALSGAFCRLGKGGSVLAFACGGAGLGFLYAEMYVWTSMPEMLVASILFLLMPVDTMAVSPRKETAQNSWGELQRVRLEDTADSYGKLARSAMMIRQEADGMEDEEGWKSRFLESREAVFMQFREMERTLKEMAAQLDQAVDVTGEYERQIRTDLKHRRLELKQLLVLKNGEDRQEAYVTVCSHRSGCVTAKEVGEAVGRTLSCSLRPADGGRTVVGKEPCTIRLVEETRFRLLSGTARECKEKEDLSGDNFSCHELPGGRVMLCLSDGMGSGRQAFLESQLVTETLEELLDAAFAPERAIYMVNSLMLVQEEQVPVTLDLALVDLYTGKARFFKQGAVGTFIRRGNQVLQIEPGALPVGVDCEAVPLSEELQLQNGDMIVMVTDGVLDALEGEDKEAILCEYLAASAGHNARELAADILQMAKGGQKTIRDDMTVLVAGVWKK